MMNIIGVGCCLLESDKVRRLELTLAMKKKGLPNLPIGTWRHSSKVVHRRRRRRCLSSFRGRSCKRPLPQSLSRVCITRQKEDTPRQLTFNSWVHETTFTAPDVGSISGNSSVFTLDENEHFGSIFQNKPYLEVVCAVTLRNQK